MPLDIGDLTVRLNGDRPADDLRGEHGDLEVIAFPVGSDVDAEHAVELDVGSRLLLGLADGGLLDRLPRLDPAAGKAPPVQTVVLADQQNATGIVRYEDRCPAPHECDTNAMDAEEPIPLQTGRRRDLEEVMSDEIPDLPWSVREVATATNPLGGFLVRTQAGVHRYVRDLTPALARKLAHQLALTVRLRADQ